MNSTAKVRPLVETDDRDVKAIVEAALRGTGFAVTDGTKVVVDLDPPTPTPPVPRRQPEFFA
jgi:hypothetical protein